MALYWIYPSIFILYVVRPCQGLRNYPDNEGKMKYVLLSPKITTSAAPVALANKLMEEAPRIRDTVSLIVGTLLRKLRQSLLLHNHWFYWGV